MRRQFWRSPTEGAGSSSQLEISLDLLLYLGTLWTSYRQACSHGDLREEGRPPPKLLLCHAGGGPKALWNVCPRQAADGGVYAVHETAHWGTSRPEVPNPQAMNLR